MTQKAIQINKQTDTEQINTEGLRTQSTIVAKAKGDFEIKLISSQTLKNTETNSQRLRTQAFLRIQRQTHKDKAIRQS